MRALHDFLQVQIDPSITWDLWVGEAFQSQHLMALSEAIEH